MKKVLSAAAALGVFLTLPAAVFGGAAMSDEQILKELEYLRNKVASQQEHIDALGAMVDKKVSAKVEEEVKKSGGSKVVLANEFIDQLKIKGDLRVRYERRERDYKAPSSSEKDRDRWRTRFRLGGVWENKAENFQVGAGLATGGTEATSTNDTWSEDEVFETGNISLDYAYAKHKWNDFAFTLGQAENPFETSWVLWDSDVRLAGLTGQYGQKEGVFATLGGYGAKLVNDENTATLVAGQLGYRGKVSDAKYTLATGYHTYSKSLINDGSANNLFNLDSVDAEKYELSIGDLYGDLSIPVGGVKLSLYGNVWKNFGADGVAGQSQASTYAGKPEDADMGWVLGLDAKYGDYKIGYAYSVVEADSLFGYLADSDFGDGLSDTNKKGHRVQLGYSLSKNWGTSLTWYNFERDEDTGGTGVDQVDIYQFDVSYKF